MTELNPQQRAALHFIAVTCEQRRPPRFTLTDRRAFLWNPDRRARRPYVALPVDDFMSLFFMALVDLHESQASATPGAFAALDGAFVDAGGAAWSDDYEKAA